MFGRKKLKKDNAILENKIKEREKFIDAQRDEICLLNKKIKLMQERIYDLEAQCEFLFNNLSKKKRELISPDKNN